MKSQPSHKAPHLLSSQPDLGCGECWEPALRGECRGQGLEDRRGRRVGRWSPAAALAARRRVGHGAQDALGTGRHGPPLCTATPATALTVRHVTFSFFLPLTKFIKTLKSSSLLKTSRNQLFKSIKTVGRVPRTWQPTTFIPVTRRSGGALAPSLAGSQTQRCCSGLSLPVTG